MKTKLPFAMVGTSKTVPDIFYLTHFRAPDPVCAVAMPDGEALLVVSSMELGRARREAAPACRVETAETLGLGLGPGASPDSTLGAVLAKEKIRRVLVHPDCPAGAVRAVEAGGVEVSVARESPWAEERQIKTPREIRAIALSQRAARRAEKALGDEIKAAEPDGRGRLRLRGALLTSELARRIVRQELVAADAIDEDGTIVAGGVQAADPHEASHGALRAGEAIVADVFPRSLKTGYWGDMTRTHCSGRLSRDVRALRDAVAEAQKIAIGAIRPGASGAEVHAAVKDFFERKGFRTGRDASGRPYGFIHSTGHGVGLEIHEEPRLSPSGQLLRPGMTVTVEPGLYYPGIGGVRIEDTVLVVPAGCEIL